MSDRPKPTCPFCGAAPKENWTEKVLWFNCGTMVVANYNRHDQTTQCVQSEIGALKDRIKRLEEAVEAYRTAYTPDGHVAPHDCFATGPSTGNPIQDLVACPGCWAERKAKEAKP